MSTKEAPYYQPIHDEMVVFQKASELKLPVLLKGPTGCGKSRFVEAMAYQLNRPLIQVSCNEDTTASDLLGRFLIKGGDTVWQDGPVTRALREGALLYLDEVAEAREDVVVVLHSLTDHRREIYLDRLGEALQAPSSFQLIASFNPGYQSGLREMKPSTRQRFLTIPFSYPSMELEKTIVLREAGCEVKQAEQLVKLGKQIRSLNQLGMRETVSTRLLIYAAKLMTAGMPPRQACFYAIAQSLSDDDDVIASLVDVISLHF